MRKRLTFLGRNAMRYEVGFIPAFAQTLDVHLLRLSKFSTVLALGNGTTFLLNLEQGAVSVVAGGRAVALDACLTDRRVSTMKTMSRDYMLTMRTSCR